MSINRRRFDQLRSDYLHTNIRPVLSTCREGVTVAYISYAVRNKYGGRSAALLGGACNVGHANTNN